MIKLFLFIAIWNGNEYVLDSGLTRDECTVAIERGVTQINLSESVTLYGDFQLFCEEEK